MCSCAVGFLLVFGAVKVYLNKNMGKRKGFPNEENPQMEWDDSGLNITENPLENLEVRVILCSLNLSEESHKLKLKKKSFFSAKGCASCIPFKKLK